LAKGRAKFEKVVERAGMRKADAQGSKDVNPVRDYILEERHCRFFRRLTRRVLSEALVDGSDPTGSPAGFR
jgi:hypothetical protein